MERYEIVFKRSVAKDLHNFPTGDVRKILQRIDALAIDPRADGCAKLSGQSRYRVRQGVYRIIFEILDKRLIVTIVKVSHRSDIYQQS
jgi:mRNA interferase RelE/StbE